MPLKTKANLLCLILLPVFAVFLRLTEFTTEVFVENTENQLSWSICGDAAITSNMGLRKLDRIEILAEESLFPVGGKALTIQQRGGIVFRTTLPRKFSIPRSSAGDWWIDKEYGKPAVAFAQNVKVEGPFLLRTSFTGRSFRPTVMILRVDKVIQVRFFRGLLNNFYEIIAPDGRVLNGRILRLPVQRSLSSILNTISHGLAAGCLLVLLFSLLSKLPIKINLDWTFPNRLILISLLVLFLITSIWIAIFVFEGVPHFQDDLNYLLRAKWLLKGKLYQEGPSFAQNLRIPSTVFWQDRWLSSYPIHWPILVAIGLYLKLPWLISMLSGVLALILIY